MRVEKDEDRDSFDIKDEGSSNEETFKKTVEKEESPASESEEKRKEKKPSAAFQGFFSKVEGAQGPEEKIRLCLDFMRSAISYSGTPHFKEFWEARRLCLPLFKEPFSPAKRAQLWAEYIELSAEARQLKTIADEQSAFASEQIGLAIKALEHDLDHYGEQLQQIPPLDYLESISVFEKKKDLYNAYQRELHLLNTFASRINSLRKEIVKTDMRARQKSLFFEKLSTCGDRVFPRRKELIKLVSQEFINDVQQFIKTHFADEHKRIRELYNIREEIKALQSIAKLLTLNTHAFTETRSQLSECWDKIKVWEKERKKEFAQKKAVFKQNYDQVLEKIKELSQEVAQESINEQEAQRKSEAILEMMKPIELGREEVKSLKEELNKATRPLFEKRKLLEQEKEKQEKEQDRKRREQISILKEEIQKLSCLAPELRFEELKAKYEEFQQQCDQLSMTRAEKQIIERSLKQIKDLIHEKKEKEVLNLSKDDLESLKELKGLLQERKERRQEIKTNLEEYRKAIGGSGLDFEKAMLYRDLMEEEKIRLDKANDAISEIEDKIAELEGK